MYVFGKPLQEGILLKRNSQFTMDVLLNGEVIKCHCPTTGRIGNVETKNIACLLSKSNDTKRKLPYTVEAVSCDELTARNKNWIGNLECGYAFYSIWCRTYIPLQYY